MSAKKSYADRDDSEDDEEMMDGVAEWEYLNEEGDAHSDDPSAAKSPSPKTNRKSRAGAKPNKSETPEPKEETPEVSSPVAHPTPRSNGKKYAAAPTPESRSDKVAKKPLRESIAKSSPLNRPSPATTAKSKATPTKITKLKPKSPLVRAKARTPFAVAAAARPAAGKTKAATGKGKGKGKKAPVKDVFDMDDSD